MYLFFPYYRWDSCNDGERIKQARAYRRHCFGSRLWPRDDQVRRGFGMATEVASGISVIPFSESIVLLLTAFIPLNTEAFSRA